MNGNRPMEAKQNSYRNSNEGGSLNKKGFDLLRVFQSDVKENSGTTFTGLRSEECLVTSQATVFHYF